MSGTVYPVWPFTSRPQALEWQRTRGGAQTEYFHAQQTALHFLRYLKAPEVDTVLADEPERTSLGLGRKVTLGRKSGGSPLTEVHLVRLGSGPGAPYVVTGATAPELQITAPAPAAPVHSPLQVRGNTTETGAPVFARLLVLSRDLPLAQGYGDPTTTGSWTATLDYQQPSERVGALVARTESAGQGTNQLAVTPVILAVPLPAVAPDSFVAALHGRIAVFESATGRLVRYLTTGQSGLGRDHSPVVTANRRTVFFLRTEGVCTSEVWRVPYDGGPVLRLFASVGLFSLVEADNGRLLAYVTGGFVEGCSSGPQRVVVRDTVTGAIRTLRTPRPEVTDLALSPDFGLAVVEPSTDSKQGLHIRVVDYRTATTTAQGRPIRFPSGCSLLAPVWVPAALAALRNCPGDNRKVVFDPRTLTALGAGTALPGTFPIDGFGSDAAGNLIAQSVGADTIGDVLFLIGGQGQVLLALDCSSAEPAELVECPTGPDW